MLNSYHSCRCKSGTRSTMAIKNFFWLAFLLTMLFSYAASKAMLSTDEIAELGCNPFSGWQTCIGKRLAERYNDRDIERAIKELEAESNEFPEQNEASSIHDFRAHKSLKRRKDAGDKEHVKQRLFNAFLKLFNEKFSNTRE